MNSIIRSRAIDGKVDVWSAEGVGTEIKVTFSAEVPEDNESSSGDAELAKIYEDLKRPTITLWGFDTSHRGVELLRNVLYSYIVSRWKFNISEDLSVSDVAIINEDVQPVLDMVASQRTDKSFIILSSARGDPRLMGVVKEYQMVGGYCRIIYKPAGPCRIQSALKLCLHALNIGKTSRVKDLSNQASQSNPNLNGTEGTPPGGLPRRFSEEPGVSTVSLSRPSLGPRAVTVHPSASWSQLSRTEEIEEHEAEVVSDSDVPGQRTPMPTIHIGSGGTLLRSAIGTVAPIGVVRVLVVEDNSILRGLLVKWLKHKVSPIHLYTKTFNLIAVGKGYDFREAVDGLEGVRVFESDGPFE